jgi:hypothetical protein
LTAAAFAYAQAVEVTDQMDGKARAGQYFESRKPSKSKVSGDREEASGSSSVGGGGGEPHYLALHLGAFVDDQAYRWGAGDQHKIGNLDIGVTYRMGEWVNTADFMIRAEYSSYDLEEGDARKINLLGMLMFPDSHSHFPLYFGAGLGPGFYIKQIHGHSAMSLDYQIVAGVRFLNVIDNLGFLGEFGLKNDIQLFSVGQFNGLFAGLGVVWTF